MPPELWDDTVKEYAPTYCEMVIVMLRVKLVGEMSPVDLREPAWIVLLLAK